MYKDGGVAILDQIICSHAKYFMGSYESTFSFRMSSKRSITTETISLKERKRARESKTGKEREATTEGGRIFGLPIVVVVFVCLFKHLQRRSKKECN